MSMSTGQKVALGCGCVALLAVGVIAAVVGLGGFWLKGKAKEMAGGLERIAAKTDEISRWEKKANSYSYTPRPDGVIPEDRFLKFLETRKQVYAVYERYQGDIEALQKKSESAGNKLTPADAWSAGGKIAEVFGEVRLAQMKALAEQGMNEEEYRAIQFAVYKSAWASATEKETGRMPAEAMSESMRKAQEALREGLKTAQEKGVPGSEKISEADAKKLEEGLGQVGQGGAEALAVPTANVELFRKYEADIKKYAMHGLAFIGF
jgi:SpoVK/Ycf46/Vps4 family AAA+-type ATPase